MSTSGASRGGAPAPSWAGPTLHPYDAGESRYNNQANNKLITRLGIGDAIAGTGIYDFCTAGQSLDLGYNGVGLTQDTSKSWPIQYRNELAYLLGGLPVLEGVVPATGQDDRWAIAGGVNRSSAPAYLTAVGAGTATITTGVGTSITVFFSNASTNATTFTVDGGAPQTLTPIGGNALNFVTLGGLANTTHVLVWTSTAGTNFLAGYGISGATTGIRCSNLSLGGASYAFGTTYLNWSDHTSAGSLQDSRLFMMSTMGIVPQTVFYGALGNDALHGVSVAAGMAGIVDLETRFTASDRVLMNSWNVTPIGPTTYAPYQAATYAHADAINAQLFDICDVIVNLVAGITAGAIGPDNIHPKYKTQTIFGRQNAIAYAA